MWSLIVGSSGFSPSTPTRCSASARRAGVSPTMEAGRIIAWRVEEGAKLSPQDVIAEVETDKAAMEVESRGSWPPMTSSMRAESATVRENGPIWSRLEAKATRPYRDTAP